MERDQLQALSRQGRITGDVLGNALINTLEQSRITIRNSQVSLSQATTLIGNSLTRLVGNLDNSLGATVAVANGTRFLTDQLDNLNALVGTGTIGSLIGSQFQGINRDISETLRILGLTEEALIASGGSVSTFITQAFAEIVPNIRQFIQILTVEIAAFVDGVAASFGFVFENLASGNFTALLENNNNGPLAAIQQVREASLQAIFDQRAADDAATQAIINNINARIDAFRREREARLARLQQPVDTLEARPQQQQAITPQDEQFIARLQGRLAQEEQLIDRSIANQNRIRNGGLLEQESNEQLSYIRRIQNLQNQEDQLISRIGQDNAERLGLIRQFTDLEVAITAQSQQRIAAIRAQSARQQTQAVLGSFAQLQQLNERSLGLQRVAIVANTASAVIQSYNNAGGYPLGIVPAGIMAAIGQRQLSQVGKSSIAGAGGGASTASPGITQPTLSQDPFITTESSQANEVLDLLRNQDPTQLYTNEQLRQIVASIASLENSGQL